jgi:hypothetical protein
MSAEQRNPEHLVWAGSQLNGAYLLPGARYEELAMRANKHGFKSTTLTSIFGLAAAFAEKHC